MATIQRDSALSALRAIAYRLSSTPATNLPPLLTHLSSQIGPCKELLNTPQPAHSEAAAFVHQLRTRASSLLQDRAPEARLAAVILIKALIEIGGYEILANNGGPWVRGLISMITRQDSTANGTRKLVITCVTRIITLAKDHDSLAREIATPNLPPFVTACLTVFEGAKDNWGSRQRALIHTVMKSWITLIPRHTATFRPFIGRILAILAKVIEIPTEKAEAKSQRDIWELSLKDAARSVYVLLHNSSTKSGSLPDRETGLAQALTKVLKSTQETFTAVFGNDIYSRSAHVPSELPLSSAEEIRDDILFLQSYITTPSFKPVSIPIGKISLLITQITATSSSKHQNNNQNVSKKDRDQFLLDLSQIYLAMISLIRSILTRFGSTSLAVSYQLLDAVMSIHDIHKANPHVRGPCYTAASEIISLFAVGLSKKQCTSLTPLIQSCCVDILPVMVQQHEQAEALSESQQKITLSNSSLITSRLPTAAFTSHSNLPLTTSASRLLSAALKHLPASHIKPPVRALMDRTAILTQNAEALVASAVNPAFGRGGSLLPFAARCKAAREEVEPIIRPRLPAILTGKVEVLSEGEAEPVMEEKQNDWLRQAATSSGAAIHDTESAKNGELDDIDMDAANDEARYEAGNEQKQFVNPAGEAFKRLQEQDTATAQSSKHALHHADEEDGSGIISPAKRPRFEYNQVVASDAQREFALPVVEQKTGNVHTFTEPSLIGTAMKQAAVDDSDDDSDFEIPKLVWADDEIPSSEHSSEE